MSEPSAPAPTTTTKVLVTLTLVVVAAALRMGAATNEFWLDEIWTLRIANELDSAWQAFTKRHDNNHVLVTLLVRLLGPMDSPLPYRLPSVIAGTGSVLLVLTMGWRRHFPAAATAATLLAVSYPLVLYGGEARGYALVVFFALAAYYALGVHHAQRSSAALVTWWTVTTLGMVAHATFAYVYVALLAWDAARALAGPDRREALRPLLVRHALPSTVIVALYVLLFRDVAIGGGPEYELLAVIRLAVARAIGTPTTGLLGIAGLAIVVATVLAGIGLLRRETGARWVFFLTVLLLAPAVVLIAVQPTQLYFRYFLVSIAFFLLLAGEVLGAAWEHSRAGRVGCLLALAAFTMGQAEPNWHLVTAGRSGCRDTVQYLVDHTADTQIVVGSDHDLRNVTMLWWYLRFAPPGRSLHYVDQRSWSAEGPPWLLRHSFGAPPGTILPIVQDGAGRTFRFEAAFECGGARRWHWLVYRNAATS